MKLESAIQSEILKWFNKQKKCYAFKVNPPPNGIPDVHILIRGVPFYLEVKRTEDDEPRDLQVYRIEQLRKAGGTAHVVRSLSESKAIVHDRLKDLGVKQKVLLSFK